MCAERTHVAFQTWKETSFDRRAGLFRNLASVLRSKKVDLSKLAAVEMGKALGEGVGEIEKCALICEYFAERGEDFLRPEPVTQEHAMAPLPGGKNYVAFNPLGAILIIMPWNFPFWQVFRFAVPTIIAGNGAVLKHASNVQGCAFAIESCFKKAGFPSDIFRNVSVSGENTKNVILTW